MGAPVEADRRSSLVTRGSDAALSRLPIRHDEAGVRGALMFAARCAGRPRREFARTLLGQRLSVFQLIKTRDVLLMDESVRLRAIVEVCEEALERLMREPGLPPAGFVEDVERLRDTARAQLARFVDTAGRR